MAPLFGRYEAATLLAVEQANGGEMAGLEQVIATFQGLFGSSVTPTTFAEATELLVSARLVEWKSNCLALTVQGRRLIRRSGSHWDSDFPEEVADKLSELDESDLAPEGELDSPSEDDVRRAMRSFSQDVLVGEAPLPGGTLAPSNLTMRNNIGIRLMQGLQPGMGFSVELPHLLVPPKAEGSGEDEGPEEEDRSGFIVPSRSEIAGVEEDEQEA